MAAIDEDIIQIQLQKLFLVKFTEELIKSNDLPAVLKVLNSTASLLEWIRANISAEEMNKDLVQYKCNLNSELYEKYLCGKDDQKNKKILMYLTALDQKVKSEAEEANRSGKQEAFDLVKLDPSILKNCDVTNEEAKEIGQIVLLLTRGISIPFFASDDSINSWAENTKKIFEDPIFQCDLYRKIAEKQKEIDAVDIQQKDALITLQDYIQTILMIIQWDSYKVSSQAKEISYVIGDKEYKNTLPHSLFEYWQILKELKLKLDKGFSVAECIKEIRPFIPRLKGFAEESKSTQNTIHARHYEWHSNFLDSLCSVFDAALTPSAPPAWGPRKPSSRDADTSGSHSKRQSTVIKVRIFLSTAENLSTDMMRQARKEKQPILIKREDKFFIYGLEEGKWEEQRLENLSANDLKVLNELEFNRSALESDSVALKGLVDKYHREESVHDELSRKFKNFPPQEKSTSGDNASSSSADPQPTSAPFQFLLRRNSTTVGSSSDAPSQSTASNPNPFASLRKTGVLEKSPINPWMEITASYSFQCLSMGQWSALTSKKEDKQISLAVISGLINCKVYFPDKKEADQFTIEGLDAEKAEAIKNEIKAGKLSEETSQFLLSYIKKQFYPDAPELESSPASPSASENPEKKEKPDPSSPIRLSASRDALLHSPVPTAENQVTPSAGADQQASPPRRMPSPANGGGV